MLKNEELKLYLEITTKTEQEAMDLGAIIHEQLRGNKDYIDSNIVLNCTEGDGVVRLAIFKECEEIPQITLFKKE